MNLNQRVKAFVQLGLFLDRHFATTWEANHQRFHEDLDKVSNMVFSYNGWFTKPNVDEALKGIAHMLKEDALQRFTASVKEPAAAKQVAVIMAGNIPAVGFHDVMCVLLSGHKVLMKLSSDDHALVPFLVGMLIYFEPELAPFVQIAEGKLEKFDAVIATGSNNSAMHFHYYFGKYPHIIRKNRSSVAVLSGKESTDELKALGKDIFQYFGLGCRNVSKLYVPQGYAFETFFESMFDYKSVIDNNKYANNYEYNRAIYLLDGVPFLDNNFLMIRESEAMHPPASVVFYEYYNTLPELVERLNRDEQELQCIVSSKPLQGAPIASTRPGETQRPDIDDFADRVDTLAFLGNLGGGSGV